MMFFMSDMDDLKERIESFLATSGMSPTVFGRKALNDPNFVFDLRADKRSPSIRTICSWRIDLRSPGSDQSTLLLYRKDRDHRHWQ